jgi:hypothetical protein
LATGIWVNIVIGTIIDELHEIASDTIDDLKYLQNVKTDRIIGATDSLIRCDGSSLANMINFIAPQSKYTLSQQYIFTDYLRSDSSITYETMYTAALSAHDSINKLNVLIASLTESAVSFTWPKLTVRVVYLTMSSLQQELYNNYEQRKSNFDATDYVSMIGLLNIPGEYQYDLPVKTNENSKLSAVLTIIRAAIRCDEKVAFMSVSQQSLHAMCTTI